MSELPSVQLRYIDKCTQCNGLGTWPPGGKICAKCKGRGWTPKAEYTAYLKAKSTGTLERRLFLALMGLIAALAFVSLLGMIW